MPKRKTISFFLAFILIVNCSFYVPSQKNNDKEYALKAAFIYHFTQYIEWPNNDNYKFNIKVLGPSPLVVQLLVVAENKTVNNKPISIVQIDDLNELGSCQILYIPKNSGYTLESVLAAIGNRNILVITEQEGYCAKGAHINMLVVGNKLRFEVNLKSATNSGLKVSSELLQHATVLN